MVGTVLLTSEVNSMNDVPKAWTTNPSQLAVVWQVFSPSSQRPPDFLASGHFTEDNFSTSREWRGTQDDSKELVT